MIKRRSHQNTPDKSPNLGNTYRKNWRTFDGQTKGKAARCKDTVASSILRSGRAKPSSTRHCAGEMNRFFCPRYHVFSLQDGTPLAAAGALWVMLDTRQRRIVSPQSVDLGFPDNSDLPAPIDLPTRLPALKSDAPAYSAARPCTPIST